MYNNVLKAINAGKVHTTKHNTEPERKDNEKYHSEDEKSNAYTEATVMDYVNKAHDFTKTSWEDLSSAFNLLRKRCPQSWDLNLESLAKSFHKNIMILKNDENLAQYIDPEKKVSSSADSKGEYSAKDLIISPELWNMESKKSGIELKKLLNYFTIYAPFEGRPFIRTWLEALVPCFSHWILRSYSKNTVVIQTLKNFLGAFGQDGIVVCLADKGFMLMNSLQDAARSVEALGRGTVEHYYWKQLTETNCGGNSDWRKLASIPSWSRDLSQLDCLPEDWLLDSTDFVQVFANIVSPEISERFEEIIKQSFSGKKLNATIKAGPAKTLARSIAKSHCYRAEFLANSKLKRWSAFEERFSKVFGRSPKNVEDFVWNVMDFARCSVTVSSASDVLMVKEILEESFLVVCVKNGYNTSVHVKGSGYRDLKLLIEVEFDHLKLENVPQVRPKTKLICEIQIICEAWLENKITTSLSYKILRATNLKGLLSDFSKYVQETCTVKTFKPEEVLKNGWLNIGKITDFSNIHGSTLLLTAARVGWSAGGLSILVKELKANINVTTSLGMTPLHNAASDGHDNLVKTLIDLKSNLHAKSNLWDTPLHIAARNCRESCIRVLLDAGASLELKNKHGKTAVDIFNQYHPNNTRILKMLKGHPVPVLGAKSEKKVLLIDELESAAVEGVLARHFDSINLPQTEVSKLFAKVAVVCKVENILQVLWFGGKINHRDAKGRTALYHASKHGYLASVITLLDERANVNATTIQKWTPLHISAKACFKRISQTLIAAGSDIEANSESGMTPIHVAAKNGKYNMIPILLAAGANINARTKNGSCPLDLATCEKTKMALQAGLTKG